MSPNELIILLSEGMEPEEMNMPFSISMGTQADNISIRMPGLQDKKKPANYTHVDGWYKHKRLAVCGIVMTDDGKMERG